MPRAVITVERVKDMVDRAIREQLREVHNRVRTLSTQLDDAEYRMKYYSTRLQVITEVAYFLDRKHRGLKDRTAARISYEHLAILLRASDAKSEQWWATVSRMSMGRLLTELDKLVPEFARYNEEMDDATLRTGADLYDYAMGDME